MQPYNLTLIIAFGAGVLSFLSPCVLPLLPAYLAHLTGEATLSTRTSSFRWTPVLHSLCFVGGFSLFLVGLGLTMGLVGSFIAGYVPWLRRLAGLFLVVLGLHVAGVIRIPPLYQERRLDYRGGERAGFLRSFLVGLAFSVGWTPCVGPILGAVLSLAYVSETAFRGAALLGSYAVGLGMPFVALALGTGTVWRWRQKIAPYQRLISWITGLLLIAVGVLIFADRLTALNRYFDFFGLGRGI